jgi:hypothetical protein
MWTTIYYLFNEYHIFVYLHGRMLQVSDLKGVVHIVHIIHTFSPNPRSWQKKTFNLWTVWTTQKLIVHIVHKVTRPKNKRELPWCSRPLVVDKST